MAKVNWNLMSQQFGEAFNYTLENERRRAQQQEQFNKEMAFQNRQLDLTEAYRKETLGIDRENLALDKSQEERLGTTAKIDIMKSLTPSQEGSAGSMTGADWEKQTGVDLYPTGKEKDFYSLFQESIPKSYNETTLEPFSIGGKFGQIEKKWEVDPNDPTKRRLIDTGTFYSDETKTDSNGDGDGTGGVDISNEAGEVKQLLELYSGFDKGETEVKFIDDKGQPMNLDKRLWRTMMAKPLEDMLTKTGLAPESDVIANLWKGIDKPEYKATDKRETLKSRIYELRRQNAIDEAQYQALLLMTEAKTK